MDKSYDASKSEGSSEEEWMDLSKSDYAKVIFSNLYWHSGSGDVGCYFTLTETVNKNPSDYIGIYKVGYEHLSQCLAVKKLSEYKCDDDSKPIHCCFKAEELPELNGFYQFLYVTHENEVCGASMPFEVRITEKREPSVEEVVTERIENDFLMVRYGLEQKNYKLETLLKTYQAENVVLVTKIKELRGEKALLTQELEEARQALSAMLEDFKQLKDEHIMLSEELEAEKLKSADAVELNQSAQKRHDIISSELQIAKEDLDKSMQVVKETEIRFQNAATVCESLKAALDEKDLVVADSYKIIAELREVIRSKAADIEKIKNESHDSTKAKDLLIEEYKRRIDQLGLQMEKLASELFSKEKLLRNQRNSDREQKYNLMEIDLQNALCKRNALEKEVQQLKRYLQNPQEYTKRASFEAAFSRLQTTEDERLIVEQLEDAKFMVKALEDSKQLAMKEMHELSEKLKKAKEELGQMKCENMALKIFLEDKTTSCCSPSEGMKMIMAKNMRAHTENVQTKLLSIMKSADPTVDMDNLEMKLFDLITHANHQSEEIKKGKAELSQLKCENMALKIFLEEKTKSDSSEENAAQNKTSEEEKNNEHSDKEIQVDNVTVLMSLLSQMKETDPSINMENIEEKIGELVMNAQHQAEEISKLNEECKRKEEEIESLNKKIQVLQKTTLDALMNAEDKTARIVQAAELYKELYKEKEKLAKQLRKLTLMKSRSKKSTFSKAQDNSEPSFLALNIEKALTSSETTSNNSDSDTGEHVRAQILYPNLKEDENYVAELSLPQAPVMVETEVKSHNECNSIDVAINNLCAAVKEDQVYKAPSKMDSFSLQQPLSVEHDTHIPCLICGLSFLVTPHSNIPMMEHIEKEHNMDICPMCGQMFDKTFPSKYLMFHINDHFQSE